MVVTPSPAGIPGSADLSRRADVVVIGAGIVGAC
jgi:hypothetical protein